MDLVVTERIMITPTVCRFEFRHPAGSRLPGFTAGAHVTIHTPSGMPRSYSLCNDDRETDRYEIAVKREDAGRGGSSSLHDRLRRGDHVTVSEPRSLYELCAADHYLLIAGGIGITPMIALFRRLSREGGGAFTLIYCTRSRHDAPYRDELLSSPHADRVLFHHSDSAGGRRFDFWPYLKAPNNTALYYCGPETMMDAIYALTVHWPRSAVHCESFGGNAGMAKPFRICRARDGRIFHVPADKTVVEVLREAECRPACSCESGTCGTCRVRLLGGVPDHRDVVLAEHEKADFFMPCVSRAFSDELLLDI